MRILIAEDDPGSRRVLEAMLAKWGYEVVVAADGIAAWEILDPPDSPKIAILDWMMPGIDGIEVCRRVRARPDKDQTYLILLTAREAKEDIVAGLLNGANDYVTKPFDRSELEARLQVGRRVIELQQNLATRVAELEDALNQVKVLQGLLPMCCYCKKIRDDNNYWQQLEHYLTEHSDARFSHGICPECWENKVEPQLAEFGITVPRPDENGGA